jgi:hypothetical protein
MTVYLGRKVAVGLIAAEDADDAPSLPAESGRLSESTADPWVNTSPEGFLRHVQNDLLLGLIQLHSLNVPSFLRFDSDLQR